MKTIACCEDEKFLFKTIITLGSFDGIHIGHQALFETALKIGQKEKIKTAVYTFKNHPLKKISPQNAPKMLMGLRDKEKLITQFGFDYLILTDFNKKIQLMEPEAFVDQVLVSQFNINVAVVGRNYRFGNNGRGDTLMLQKLGEKYNFSTVIVDPVKYDGEIVSSTRIRTLIDNGKVKEASFLLGRNYMLSGMVIHGYKRGRKMGFPTANLQLDNDRIVPKKGVYKTKTYLEDGRFFYSVTSVSDNPTFGENPLSVETHIINFNEEIYNRVITVAFLKRIRDEMKFNSVNQLIAQVQKDIEASKKEND